jgi:hypothetical protein
MKWSDANTVVEELRCNTKLWMPALSKRLGFSSTRVEHLLNKLVQRMPPDEVYFEVGVLNGRTLESAAVGNVDKLLVGCDAGEKYDTPMPTGLPFNVNVMMAKWQRAIEVLKKPIGVAFYDGDHAEGAVYEFMSVVGSYCAQEAVIVLDDWDRKSTRDAVFRAVENDGRFQLLREMPEYGDGLSCPPNHFGYYFGVGLVGFRRPS